MGSQYKLLGEFWDGKDSGITDMPRFITEKELGYCEDYVIMDNLFDIPMKQRKIKLSIILQLLSINEFVCMMDKVRKCNKIFIQLDYIPQNFVPIVARFFVKRLLQIYMLVRRYNPRAEVGFVTSDERWKKIKPYIEMHIRDKEIIHRLVS